MSSHPRPYQVIHAVICSSFTVSIDEFLNSIVDIPHVREVVSISLDGPSRWDSGYSDWLFSYTILIAHSHEPLDRRDLDGLRLLKGK